jgi:RHS repeat-associated protein
MSLDHAHRGTPILQVADPRGLAIRAVQYHRRLAVDPVAARVTHQQFDSAGRLVASRDPYLFALAQADELVPANLIQVMSLSGLPLLTDSVDAGWRVVLQGAAGQVLECWDGRGSHSLTQYDELLRPSAVREKGQGVDEHVLERFTYAGVGEDVIAHNLCGQLIRHDDPAGTLHLLDLGLGGALLNQTRHFLHDINPPDWPLNVTERDTLLEHGSGASTSQHYAATGELLDQTDAFGNRQSFAYTIVGELKDTRLTLEGDGQLEKILVSDIQYNPSGQIEAQTAGNGVVTRHRYDCADGRLTNLSAHKADSTPLQALNYSYDAVGNVLSLEDAAQTIRYFDNQRIEPKKTYRYDTLYQLIHATGWEVKTGRAGPALPDRQPLPLDPNQIANYTQSYHYDAGGNLLQLVHDGAQAHGRTLTRARNSNRCLPERNGRPPTEAELAVGFDANGNLRELQAGQWLEWDLRNQLTAVRPVAREEAEDDYERYIYDGGGQRVRKIRVNQTNVRTLISEVRYLPGMEIRSHGGTGEIHHVITASAGSNSIQVLHWLTQKPGDAANDQVRYNLNDHLQSGTLELDENADLISQEWYYPYGGTASFAARSDIQARYKTVHYSGKERDATGLYYYGFRYYAPWLQRWINPDPAGYVDGMNLFAMVNNRPINYGDPNGHQGNDLTQPQIDSYANQIRENAKGLLEKDIDEVIEKYLKNKSVDPKKYTEIIKAAAGVETSANNYHRKLSDHEKHGIHIFWSTNAGTRYINGITRKYFNGTSEKIMNLKKSRANAILEFGKNLGSAGTIKIDSQGKDDFSTATSLLASHEDDPRRTILLMKASLGDESKKIIYRGARLRNAYFTVDEIVQASGFMSFSPDEKTAEEFSTKKYHEASYADTTSPVIFIAKGAHDIKGITETELLFKPSQRFLVTKVISSGGKNRVWIEKTSSKPNGSTRWI